MKPHTAATTYISCKDRSQVAAFLGSSFTLDITAELAEMEAITDRERTTHSSEMLAVNSSTDLCSTSEDLNAGKCKTPNTMKYVMTKVQKKVHVKQYSMKRSDDKILKKRMRHLRKQLQEGKELQVLAIV